VTGTVKLFIPARVDPVTAERKGFFGFVLLDTGRGQGHSIEYFFHGSSVVGDLVSTGDTVDFQIVDGRDGAPRAVDVRKRRFE
jgi:hypothetical protein